MLPAEWIAMGGEHCDDCSTCINSELYEFSSGLETFFDTDAQSGSYSAFAKAYPDIVDEKFKQHWESWFSQDDVDQLVELGLNVVRIPVRGFFHRRGLQQLSKAGIVAILDHHALPGVQDPQQQFTGRCTSDVEFYTPHNYDRALVWTAVMTALSHVDPAFSNVVAIEAVNEPIMDANQTPGYGEFQKNFVLVVRAVELLLGIPVPKLDSSLHIDILFNVSITASLELAAHLPPIFSSDVKKAVTNAIPILLKICDQLSVKEILNLSRSRNKENLITKFVKAYDVVTIIVSNEWPV
ncbi:hypothetical protein C0992_008115 [Termitomyces sp. T32_za158]|nr:hypothetical protein C0992_008115 [Termitomyces sp. T32_za158]